MNSRPQPDGKSPFRESLIHITKIDRSIHMKKVSLAILIAFLLVTGGKPIWADDATGTLVGHVVFPGSPDPGQTIELTRDVDFCGKTMTIKTIATDRDTGGLEGAVVSIDGLPATATESLPPTTTIANNHCSFSPRTSVGQVGQQLIIRNDDPVLHNTHLTLETRTFLNVALVPAGRPIEKHLRKPGQYQIRCDAHRFMSGALKTFPHPFFSLTDGKGSFRITRLPPGEHVVNVWHETLGTIQKQITIPPRGEATVTIEYPKNASPANK
jgi:plastocyanin